MIDEGAPIKLQRDGNQWMAVFDTFINAAESPSGYGDTPEEAIADLKEVAKTFDPRALDDTDPTA